MQHHAARSRRCCIGARLRRCSGRRRAPVLRLGGHLFDPAAGARGRAEGEQARAHSRRDRPDVIATANIGCIDASRNAAPGLPVRHWIELLDARDGRRPAGGCRDGQSGTDGANGMTEPLAPAFRAAYPPFPRDPDPVDGQRRVRPRQQRHVLLVLRHGGERASDPRRRPRHPQRPDHRRRRRDGVPLSRSR